MTNEDNAIIARVKAIEEEGGAEQFDIVTHNKGEEVVYDSEPIENSEKFSLFFPIYPNLPTTFVEVTLIIKLRNVTNFIFKGNRSFENKIF